MARCAKDFESRQQRKYAKSLDVGCCLCCAHAQLARIDRTERACYGIYRPANATVRDKHDGCAAYALIREQQLPSDAHRRVH